MAEGVDADAAEPCLALPVAVMFEGAQAWRGQEDASFGTLESWSGRWPGRRSWCVKGASDAGDSTGQVEVLPAKIEKFGLAEPSVQSEFEQSLPPVTAGGGQERARFRGGAVVCRSGHCRPRCTGSPPCARRALGQT